MVVVCCETLIFSFKKELRPKDDRAEAWQLQKRRQPVKADSSPALRDRNDKRTYASPRWGRAVLDPYKRKDKAKSGPV
jgi:hypothetical protein